MASQNEFFIQILTCDDRVYEADCPPGQQYAKWATLADQLLTSQRILPATAPKDEHVIKVQLAYQKDAETEPVAVASVYLLCPHDIEVVAEQRVASRLKQNPTTEQKIATPSLIIPR